jgi:HAE1 family hydrophobic/amphiphilic exporter-1
VLRFDPASRRLVAGRAARSAGRASPPVELTTWADQVLKKRLENVRGVGAVNLVGATKREINIYLDPPALEAYGITPDQVAQAVRSENQDLPVGAIRSLAQERVVQIDARMQRPRISAASSWRAAARRSAWPGGRVVDGAQELESLALYNGQRTLLLSVQKAQDENTIEVVDGLTGGGELRPSCPPACAGGHRDNSRPSAWRWTTCARR